jgi:hypothetical protein
MSTPLGFRIDVFGNEYLPEGGSDVDAIVTVTSSGSGPAAPTRAAEVLIVDCSGSMGAPRTKIDAAKQATTTAIDTLRDGVEFAIIAGTEHATQIYPRQGMVAVSPQTRDEAKRVIYGLRPDGGTAVGSWLRAADALLSQKPDAIRHAILLTDGQNQGETAQTFDAALAACAGRFTCDCRGVGTDWDVKELRKVADALLGTVDIIPDPAGLEADFRAMTQAAMGKTMGDLTLRIWTPQGASVSFVKQVLPEVVDLTGRRAAVSDQVGQYPTAAWGAESRDYHVRVQVKPAGIGDEMLAARISVVTATGDVLGQGLVRAVWTDDVALSTRINPQVAHYTGQADLAQAIQEGLEARRSGDVTTATAKLGRAVRIAAESGNAAMADLLDKVVDVVDPVTDTVRLKARVADADEMALDTRSTKTVRVRKEG